MKNPVSTKNQHIILIAIIAAAAIIIGNFVIFAGHTHNLINSYTDCVAAGYPVQETFPERCVTPEGTAFTKSDSSAQPPADGSSSSITVSGTIGCLSKPNTGGPQTLECAMGLMGDDGKSYGLSTSDNSLFMQPPSGKVKVIGSLKPVTDNKYISSGTITVSSWEAAK